MRTVFAEPGLKLVCRPVPWKLCGPYTRRCSMCTRSIKGRAGGRSRSPRRSRRDRIWSGSARYEVDLPFFSRCGRRRPVVFKRGAFPARRPRSASRLLLQHTVPAGRSHACCFRFFLGGHRNRHRGRNRNRNRNRVPSRDRPVYAHRPIRSRSRVRERFTPHVPRENPGTSSRAGSSARARDRGGTGGAEPVGDGRGKHASLKPRGFSIAITIAIAIPMPGWTI
jgi:hypothetical protein